MAYKIGLSKVKINFPYINIAFMGYGNWNNRGASQKTDLFARTCIVENNKQLFVFTNIEMAFITPGIRREVIKQLKDQNITSHNLILTAQHTHSAPSGFSEYAYYSFTTPKFRPDIQAAYTNAIVLSVKQAIANKQRATVLYKEGNFSPSDNIAWNRSLKAYNNNPEIQESVTDASKAVDTRIKLLQFNDEQGNLLGSINWLGVHATCIGNHNKKISSDNKGYAAHFLETEYPNTIHLFAQANAGDISPHFHGKKDEYIRLKTKLKGDHLYAEKHGRKQADAVKNILKNKTALTLSGEITSKCFYSDFTNVNIVPEFCEGKNNQKTSDACFGVPFFVGTRIDGKGIPKIMGIVMKNINTVINPTHRELKASQGEKQIILNAVKKQMFGKNRLDILPDFVDLSVKEMNTQYRKGALKENSLTPVVLPVQITLLANIAILGVPGEITTIAGKRLEKQMLKELNTMGITKVIVSSYANSYMGYITTKEEYDVQLYEGGHTLFGQWTLAAFQTQFSHLASYINGDQSTPIDFELKPPLFSNEELKLRSELV